MRQPFLVTLLSNILPCITYYNYYYLFTLTRWAVITFPSVYGLAMADNVNDQRKFLPIAYTCIVIAPVYMINNIFLVANGVCTCRFHSLFSNCYIIISVEEQHANATADSISLINHSKHLSLLVCSHH